LMRRRRRPPTTIFSKHNVDQLKKFCKMGVRVENLLEKEIERIAKEDASDLPSKKAAQFELIKRHREHVSKLSEVRLHLQMMFQHTGENLHEDVK